MATVLRITRHPVCSDREKFLRNIFGDDVHIFTHDIRDRVSMVPFLKTMMEWYKDVVAIEAIAPFPILSRLIDQRNELGVPLIRAVFKRDQSGRALVIGKDKRGRDILAFSCYEELVRFSFETTPLTKVCARWH